MEMTTPGSDSGRFDDAFHFVSNATTMVSDSTNACNITESYAGNASSPPCLWNDVNNTDVIDGLYDYIQFFIDGELDVVMVMWLLGATLTSVLGNAAICWIVLATPALRTTPHNRLVLNLAVCDLLMALTNAPPTVVALVSGRWTFGRVLCQVNGLTVTLFGVASVITLAGISLNRCYMVAYTAKGSRLFNVHRTNIIVTAIWLFSIVVSLPPIFGWSKYEFVADRAICTIRWMTSPTYTVSVLGFGVCVPFVVMIGAYMKIFQKVRESNRRIDSLVYNPPPFASAVNVGRSGATAAATYPGESFDDFGFPVGLVGGTRYIGHMPASAVGPTSGTAVRVGNAGSGLTRPPTANKGRPVASATGANWMVRRPSVASCSLNRFSDPTTTSSSIPGSGSTLTRKTSCGLMMMIDKAEIAVLQRSLSNIKDCSSAAGSGDTGDLPAAVDFHQVAKVASGTPSDVRGAGTAPEHNVQQSAPASTPRPEPVAVTLVTPARALVRRQLSRLIVREHKLPPPSRAWASEGLYGSTAVKSAVSAAAAAAADVSVDPSGCGDKRLTPKSSLKMLAEKHCESVADARGADGVRTLRLHNDATADLLSLSAADLLLGKLASSPSSTTAVRQRFPLSKAAVPVCGTRTIMKRESRLSYTGSGGRISLPPTTALTGTGCSVQGLYPLRRQLTGDRLMEIIARRPSSLSVTAIAAAERRANEIRAQVERTRRTRFGDELKVSLALLVVIVVFVVSWAPISLVNCLETIGFGDAVPTALDHAAVGMLYLQSALNPVLYGVMNRNFREGFKQLLRCGNAVTGRLGAGVAVRRAEKNSQIIV